MKVNAKFRPFIHTDSQVLLSTAGVLGETFIDIDSSQAKGGEVANNSELPSKEVPDIQDVVRSSQSTLQNVNILVSRLDRIVTAVEDQKGSVGKLIYDKQLYNNLNSSVAQVNGMLSDINNGRGSLGKLINDDTLYTRVSATIDKLNSIADNVNNGNGTIGKLVHDPSLYDNANQTLAKANQLMDGINRGEGGLGKFAKDPVFAKKLDSAGDESFDDFDGVASRTRHGGQVAEGPHAVQQRRSIAGAEPRAVGLVPREPEEVPQHQDAHLLVEWWRRCGPSSSARHLFPLCVCSGPL